MASSNAYDHTPEGVDLNENLYEALKTPENKASNNEGSFNNNRNWRSKIIEQTSSISSKFNIKSDKIIIANF